MLFRSTYHQLSDFKSLTARELFAKTIEDETKLQEAKKELEVKRAQYAAALANSRSSLTTEILQMEKTIGELFDHCKMTKMMARNEEIKHINGLK